MLFSIIIPAFNSERYFSECLASIESQSFDDYEVVIVDDGSTDSTRAMSDSFASEHERVTVLHGPNEGLLLARRKGLGCARGEYIVFLDADDALAPNALRVISDEIDQTGADIVSFRYSRSADFSTPNDPLPLSSGLYAGNRYGLIKEHVCRGCFNNIWGKAFRLSCIDVDADYGSYAGLMHGEDLLQLLPIIDASCSLARIEDVLYYYRLSDIASTAEFKENQLHDISRVNERLLACAEKWSGRCPELARAGEVEQYIYLLKLSELASDARALGKEHFDAIRHAMERRGTFTRSKNAPLRLDKALMEICLRRGWRLAAKVLIKSIEKAKQYRR